MLYLGTSKRKLKWSTFIKYLFLSVYNNSNFFSKIFVAITTVVTNYAVMDLGFLYCGYYVNNKATSYEEQLLDKNKFW